MSRRAGRMAGGEKKEKIRTIGSERSSDLSGVAAEGHGSAAGQAGEQVRVGDTEHAAGAVACCEEAFNGGTVCAPAHSMALMPEPDYTADDQKVFLYVKDIGGSEGGD